jgi:hypothetical protein
MRALVRPVLTAAIAAALCVAAAAPVMAVSVRDIIELSRAGLGDEVLVALIEADQSVFTLSNAQLIELKQAGVSERVILAMVRQGRGPLPSPPPPAPTDDPAPVAAPPPPTSTSTTVVVVPTPFYYPFPVFVPQRAVHRPVHCQPGRIIGRTERLTTPVSGRWVAQGRTGGMIFMSDPICE